MRLTIGFFLILVFGCEYSVFSQNSMDEWSAFTSMRETDRVFVGGSNIWVATSGGVLLYNQESGSYQRYTRLNGLPSNQVSSITMDDEGDMWFGTRFAGLSRWDIEDQMFDMPIVDFADLEINALFVSANDLYVGTNRGVSLFSINKREVKESYRQLGNLLKDTQVNALAVENGYLWVGADAGVAWADMSQLNLQDPQSWESVTSPGRVVDMILVDDLPFVATPRGVFSVSRQTGEASLDFTNLEIVSLGLYKGNLVASTRRGEMFQRETLGTWDRISSSGIVGVTDLSKTDELLWVATSDGLRVLGSEALAPAGDPPGNIFYDLVTMPNGDLWAASVPKDGYPEFGSYQYNGELWTVHNLKSGLSSEFSTALEVDANGLLWIGNWGRGVDVLDSTGTWRRYNSRNSSLRGIDNGTFVPISDIKRDAAGNMWIADVQSGLVVMESYPARRQQLIAQEDFNLATGRDLSKISVGEEGVVWVGTARDGFILVDYGASAFVLGDESGLSFNTLSHPELTSNRVSDIHYDRSGRLWVATDNGLNMLNGSYIREWNNSLPMHSFTIDQWKTYGTSDGLPSNVITALAEDDRGRIWVGTENGVVQIGSSGNIQFIHDISNSGLISNVVNSLHFDEQKNQLWIGTNNGLSLLNLSGSGLNSDHNFPLIFPNPFVLSGGNSQLTIGGLPLGAEIRIFNTAGELVRRIVGEPGEGNVVWDGLNEVGYYVSSGIYFCAVRDGASISRGSFAVVNQLR